jgi:hypothetical protein
MSRKEKKQVEHFIEKARELGCDEDEAAFEERVRKIAKAKPKPQEQSMPSSKGRRR